MRVEELKRVLSSFSDRPSDIDLTKDEVILQVQDTLITFRTVQKAGQIYVRENDIECLAEHWIANRLANLPVLATRILEYVKPIDDFVTPTGQAVAQIEDNPDDTETPVQDVVRYTTNMLDSVSGISTLVVYLTSDAGEGKTTVINQMARLQALKYQKKETDWLLLPIPLGGRPFLRLDDIISASIVNGYRFRHLYFESFLELVKYGFLVPALDGFEEMFVVGSSGEAVGSLGNLIESLGSSGRLLVAARKAYFEIRDFNCQARLFDTMHKNAASFARVKIERWGKHQFLDYWEKRGLPSADATYERLQAKFNQREHPVLSRAVLVKKLAYVASDTNRFESLIQDIEANSPRYFSTIIDSIIEREISTKWLDRSDGVAQPLLNLEQHHKLLSSVAMEMVHESITLISADNLQVLTEIFCEAESLTADLCRQVLSRIYDHPLLSKPDTNARMFSFDHDEFREYFLGEGLVNLLLSDKGSELRTIFRRVALSKGTIDVCRAILKSRHANLKLVCGMLQDISKTESQASWARENCGRLITAAIQDGNLKDIQISEASFLSDIFCDSRFEKTTFRNCFFRAAVFANCELRSCQFTKCEFESLEIQGSARITDCTMDECGVFSLLLQDIDAPVFCPEVIQGALGKAGFAFPQPVLSPRTAEEEVTTQDERLVLLTRALRVFHRSTGVNDSVFRVRLGRKAQEFLDDVVPEMLAAGVFKEDHFEGGGQGHRFRLGVTMSTINAVLRASQGNYKVFCDSIRKRQDGA